MAAEAQQPGFQPEDPADSGTVILRRCIETEAESLLGTLAVYFHRAWPMAHEEAWERAQEALAEVVTIALRKAADFDPRRNPRAWLLGIGSRVVLRQRDAVFAQRQHETGSSTRAGEEFFTDNSIFDRPGALSISDVALIVEQAESVDALLAPLSLEDGKIVSLGIIDGLNRETLARVLQCSPVAARTRLSRAVCRLRKAWAERTDGNGEGSQA